jgi:hypothetical protein
MTAIEEKECREVRHTAANFAKLMTYQIIDWRSENTKKDIEESKTEPICRHIQIAENKKQKNSEQG